MASSKYVDSSEEYVCMTYYLKTDGAQVIGPNDPSVPQESVKTPTAVKPSSLVSSTRFPAPSTELGVAADVSAQSNFVPAVLPAHELSFTALANRFSALLPQRVQVTRAMYAYGENEDALLSQDDIYDIHFVHRRKTATLVSRSGQYHVPLNSTLKFGLVYEYEHIHGSVFPTVNNIIEAENRPKVVCAQKTYIGTLPDKTVCAGEILAVVNTGTTKLVNGSTFLTVYSFACRQEKQLPFFCAANFTTTSSEVQLPLWEIVENVKDAFPSKVVPFAGTSRSSDFSQRFFSQTYDMVEIRETSTVVASPHLSDSYSREIEIPVDADVRITFIKLSDEDMSALSRYTQNVLARYDDSRIEHLWQASNFEHNRHQSQLFKNVHPLQNAIYSHMVECDTESSGEEEWPPTLADVETMASKNNDEIVKELIWLKKICDNFSKELKSLR